MKLIRNFSRACLRLSLESRASAGILLHHKLFVEAGLLAKKDKIWKKQLKAKDMRQKVKEMNFLFESIEPIATNADIQKENQNSGSSNIDNEDSLHNNQEIAILESEAEEVLTEETLLNNANSFQENNETFPYQALPSMKTESKDLSLLQEMFGRIMAEHYQENLTCRFLHRVAIVNNTRNFAECKRKDKSEAVCTENVDGIDSMQSSSDECKRKNNTEAVYSGNIDDVKSTHSSSRMNSLGYKIASKVFQFFI